MIELFVIAEYHYNQLQTDILIVQQWLSKCR